MQRISINQLAKELEKLLISECRVARKKKTDKKTTQKTKLKPRPKRKSRSQKGGMMIRPQGQRLTANEIYWGIMRYNTGNNDTPIISNLPPYTTAIFKIRFQYENKEFYIESTGKHIVDSIQELRNLITEGIFVWKIMVKVSDNIAHGLEWTTLYYNNSHPDNAMGARIYNLGSGQGLTQLVEQVQGTALNFTTIIGNAMTKPTFINQQILINILRHFYDSDNLWNTNQFHYKIFFANTTGGNFVREATGRNLLTNRL